jgi:hypothetical protein
MAGIGPTPTTWAVQQVVGYLGHTGSDANVVAEAALDPFRTNEFSSGGSTRGRGPAPTNESIAVVFR